MARKKNPDTYVRTTVIVDGKQLRQLKSKLAAEGKQISKWLRAVISKELSTK
jgi:hypothetical protein